jgi:hypothetical protein
LSTNRYSSVPGCAPSYDANGFATNDCAHTYSWDSAGNPRTIDGVSLTYDALGRMVEQEGNTRTISFSAKRVGRPTRWIKDRKGRHQKRMVQVQRVQVSTWRQRENQFPQNNGRNCTPTGQVAAMTSE